jgi:hypothetical protein
LEAGIAERYYEAAEVSTHALHVAMRSNCCLRSNFTISEPSDIFLPISQLKAKRSLSGSSSASWCLCEPFQRTRMSTKVSHGKSKLRHKQAPDTAREYGYTVHELSDLVPWFLCIYYTRSRRTNLTGVERPLIGPHSLKNRHSNHMFLSVQQCPMFVPMKNYFEYWSLLGRIWDQEQDISLENGRFQRFSHKNDISTGFIRVDNSITPATLDGLEVSTRPRLYQSLSRAGKRRVRARQLRQNDQTTQTSAISAPDHRYIVPKKLKEWRKKKFKQGEDVYKKCHTCRQVFSCGHWYITLCRDCDLSWNSRKAMECPLWAMRSNGKWKAHNFLLFLSETCGICPSAEDMDADDWTYYYTRYKRCLDLPLRFWETWSSPDSLLEDVRRHELRYLWKQYTEIEDIAEAVNQYLGRADDLEDGPWVAQKRLQTMPTLRSTGNACDSRHLYSYPSYSAMEPWTYCRLLNYSFLEPMHWKVLLSKEALSLLAGIDMRECEGDYPLFRRL